MDSASRLKVGRISHPSPSLVIRALATTSSYIVHPVNHNLLIHVHPTMNYERRSYLNPSWNNVGPSHSGLFPRGTHIVGKFIPEMGGRGGEVPGPLIVEPGLRQRIVERFDQRGLDERRIVAAPVSDEKQLL